MPPAGGDEVVELHAGRHAPAQAGLDHAGSAVA
jgi:hypothetical protein